MAAAAGTLRLSLRSKILPALLSRLRPLPGTAAVGTAARRAGEKVTHTGQVYEEGDYRKVRFVGRQKELNENFAIELVAEEPVTEVSDRVVSCDGGGGALGHPKVYLNLDKETKVGTCGYCGLRFKQIHH
ncbi:NADH dehydrogenase [ubiquinone] iron-sulfur protein 6, mitochondrial [Chiloscyllium plagiosum]|uniref:NADH dehydrogenase [ubiquinone] iron-sulfur protein 6, mitochondrial n=1 Tax=Chiloscyllium plagiosum TaxID=36176 RepID=UPI001CB81413|nr:NADH dehydrogenase [ubiquinone] iron-sulfur protein 6, mitochondrial [Chiloscyllium plagiosum]